MRGLFNFKKTRSQPQQVEKAQVFGDVYNLKQIYEEINQEYFQGKLDITISWNASKDRKATSKRVLGSYHFDKKLIRIHRILDDNKFPDYFIRYVVYHEMLHHVYPMRKGKRGRREIHHETFKTHEKNFKDYSLAVKWEKENKHLFFNPKG